MSENPQKLYIQPGQLRTDSYELASRILADKFVPDVMVSLFRGGVFIGNCIHEVFNRRADTKGKPRVNHIDIRTSKYYGIDKANATVQVHGLSYLTDIVTPETKVLIVDDIFDTGLTIEALLTAMQEKLDDKLPKDIRVATVYYKPTRNQTKREPNYYLYDTSRWVVFPHEVEGMTLEEIREAKGARIYEIFKGIDALE